MEHLTHKDVMKLKNAGERTVFAWMNNGKVNTVTVKGKRMIVNDDKLKSASVDRGKKKRSATRSEPEGLMEAMQMEIAELRKRVEKIEANPLLSTAKQPTPRNPTVLGFSLRFVNKRWIAYKRIYNKLYNVYVGSDVSQAESKIKAWLSERPEINARIAL
jgi:hypothetical protein